MVKRLWEKVNMDIAVKVSVIIPIYNVERYIEECLESVTLQKLKEIEIICINDASTDSSEEIVRRYKECDKRIVLMRNDCNRGLAYTRNVGLSVAKGKYVYFLDSDDKITLDALSNLYEYAETNQVDGIFFDASLLIDDSMLEYENAYQLYQRSGISEKVQSGIQLLHQFLKNNNFQASVPQQFWSKAFLEKNRIRFFDGILHEDELFSFQAITLAIKVCYIKERLFIRRIRAESIMTSGQSYKNLIGVWTCFYYMVLLAEENEYEDRNLVDSYIARLYNRAANLYEQYGNEIDLNDFANKRLVESFHIFSATQRRYMAYGLFSESQLEEVRKHSKIYVYGTGSIARSVVEGLIYNNFLIEGFVVTKVSNNVRVFRGHRVYEFNEIKANCTDVLVVVATSLLHQHNIISLLKKHKTQYICWQDNH